MTPTLLLFILSAGELTGGLEQVVAVRYQSRADLDQLAAEFEVVSADTETAVIHLTDDQLNRLLRGGRLVEVVIPDVRAHLDTLLQGYHSYAQACSILAALAAARADICRLDTIGLSVQNRPILGLRITDRPFIEEAEPEFRILGAHHGGEKISTEIALDFAEYVVASYDSNTAVRELVDDREIWVIPIVNPDGHVTNSRYNATGVDLNRDYGYKWYGSGRSNRPFSQPETRAIRNHSLDNNISLEFAFHSTASYVNYLWDCHPVDPPDSGHIVTLARAYAETTSTAGNGSPTVSLEPINGYEWYPVYGSCQDAGFGLWGYLSYTIETRLPSQQARIDSIGDANRRALLAMLLAAGCGVRGTVRDSATGAPLRARIAIASPARWSRFSDPRVGDYACPLPAGSYSMVVSAPGYRPVAVSGVAVPPNGSVRLDFRLSPSEGDLAIEEVSWIRHADTRHLTHEQSVSCLGQPDGDFFPLGVRGEICLAAGAAAIRNLPGDDITIHDGDTIADGYWLYAGLDWDGPWSSCGKAWGTASFDLATPGLDSARFLKIVSDSSGSSLDPHAGIDLDAATYHQPAQSIRNQKTHYTERPTSLDVAPTPSAGTVVLRFEPGTVLKIVDSSGRLVRSYHPREDLGRPQMKVAGLRTGIYLAVAEKSTGTTIRKLVVVARD